MGRLYVCLLAAMLLVTIQPQAASHDSQTLNKPFLGQIPPGKKPEVFAPGIVSLPGSTEFSCALSPDGSEFYFARKKPELNYQVIMLSKYQNGYWSSPVPVPFTSGFGDFGPAITPDGKRLFFMSWKPYSIKPPSLPDLWFVDISEAGWSKPIHFGSPFNPGKTLFISMSHSGTIYATDAEHSEIVCVRSNNGDYLEYENLGAIINCEGLDCYPYIAPDESYLIFTSIRREISVTPALFITFRLGDGNWSSPRVIKTGIANSAMPFVSPDGKYLFFSANDDIYWMDASVIEELRPDKKDKSGMARAVGISR